MDEAVSELGESLSDDARCTLERLARPIADGATISQAARESGLPSTIAATKRLATLRAELALLDPHDESARLTSTGSPRWCDRVRRSGVDDPGRLR
jgi:hypothetical protein